MADIAKLEELIQRYRREYLDTSDGQNHKQIGLRERQEVQTVFSEIKGAYEKGQDITDLVLKRLPVKT